jgi:hypothetical protein
MNYTIVYNVSLLTWLRISLWCKEPHIVHDMRRTELLTYASIMVSNIQKVTFAATIIAAPCIFATAF